MIDHITTWIIFLPALTALLIVVLGCFDKREALTKHLALAGTVGSLLLSLWALKHFAPGQIGFRDSYAWIIRWDIRYEVGMDGLSLLMVILTNLLLVISVLGSYSAITKRRREFYFFLLLLQTGINGTFCAFDLFLFYVFWEIMLIPLYFLIGIWGSANRVYATMKFVLYTLVGSLLMLVGILYLYYKFRLGDFGDASFRYLDLLRLLESGQLLLSGTEQTFLFLSFFLAFAIKVPLFPLHTWLPDAHTEAPTAGSIILAGVLLKTGAYGMLRFCIPFFPEAAVALAPVICWLAVIAIVYGAATAIAQKDMKRLVAYSSVSHMGFVVLGIFAFTLIGVSGGVLQMINHGISTSGLFLCVGLIYERRHTRLMSEFGGLAHNMKIFAVLTMVIVLSSAGLPGLNGFVGEFLILAGAFIQQPGHLGKIWVAIAASGVILGAVYLLMMVQQVFFGKLDNPKNQTLRDLNFREIVALAPLVFLAFWIGLYPKPWLRMIENSVAVKTVIRRTTAVKSQLQLTNPSKRVSPQANPGAAAPEKKHGHP